MATETYELTLEGLLGQEYRENTMHWQAVGSNPADTEAGGESLVSGWKTHIMPLWLACLPVSYQLSMVSARRVDPKISTVVRQQSVAGAETGTRSTNSTAQQTCPCIFMIPPMGNKTGGKIFMPGVAQGDITGNSYVAPYNAAITAFMAAVIAGFAQSGITWEQVIFSKKLLTSVPITDYHLSPVIGYIGKRRKAVGA
jgi:hypothetical protein